MATKNDIQRMEDLRIINCDDPVLAVEHILEAFGQAPARKIVHYLYYSNFIALQKDALFMSAMQLADYILIDGIGMQLYFKILTGLWPKNLNGTDLNPEFLRELDTLKIPVAFYGTTPVNIAEAVKRIGQYVEPTTIYYFQDGYSPLDWSAIREGSALFVGMGSPRQENWVAEHLDQIEEKKLLVVTVGGFFDFASGFYIRAPRIVRKLKLEWAWRTMLHPKRHLKKRINDLTILYKPLLDKIRGRGKFLNVRQINR